MTSSRALILKSLTESSRFRWPQVTGKSTLLRMIAGLEDISAGDMFIGEKRVNDLPPKDRSVTMVFQSYAIFPHMTVRENIGFGLTIAKTPKAEKTASPRGRAHSANGTFVGSSAQSAFVGSANALQSDGPLPANQKCFYLTNLSQTLMPRCAWICGWKLANCCNNWAQPDLRDPRSGRSNLPIKSWS